MGSGESKLPRYVVKELKATTNFKTREIREWYNAFCEECPSGKMSLSQFLSVWLDMFVSSEKQKIFNRAELETYGTEVFHSIDRDMSGSIEFREFLVNVSIETKGTLEMKLKNIFNLYDLDRDGYVTEDEMRMFIKLVNKAIDFRELRVVSGDPKDPDVVAEEITHRIFGRLDRNEDGKLTVYEFISGVQLEPCLINYFLAVRPNAVD